MTNLWVLIIFILSVMGCDSLSQPLQQLAGFTGAYNNTARPGQKDGAVLSPDGTKLIIPLLTPGGTQQLHLANRDGSHLLQITFEGGHNYSPVWSPSGREALFVSDRDGDHEIFLMDADGGYQQQLTFNEAWDSFPAWSPDGREILFASDRDGFVEMYALTDGAGTIKVAELTRMTAGTP